MSVSDSEIAFALELFSSIEGLTHRKQTGALCLYCDGKIFATAGDGAIYLKARGSFADEMEAAGARQFTLTRADGSTATNCYWTLPDAALDDPDLACNWARRALAAL
ncbi:TfoX/Sxy family protein [Sinisalibacter aestuarii]|uniref:TfoX N-terminal domain-containing protein n=1 Tax=Sinisalibacter aestuarii TaxID=2949426 RepID=A0ABQ5LRF0_9RHOB|nr:TfoX/Sxy family protein [Sinisalibacter aestuarii]GKY87585.1 hypothetical protein STA1M1_14540 [Sinisalibacter aestuarii]